jgi:hypothetical protein
MRSSSKFDVFVSELGTSLNADNPLGNASVAVKDYSSALTVQIIGDNLSIANPSRTIFISSNGDHFRVSENTAHPLENMLDYGGGKAESAEDLAMEIAKLAALGF